MQDTASDRIERSLRLARLRKHADYQRVYKASRKHPSASMTYFFYRRSSDEVATAAGSRVGLTAGRVLGKAVDRNRIKRRMREAVRFNLHYLTSNVDVILHPRRSVLEMDFARLRTEVGRIFSAVEAALNKAQPTPDPRQDAQP